MATASQREQTSALRTEAAEKATLYQICTVRPPLPFTRLSLGVPHACEHSPLRILCYWGKEMPGLLQNPDPNSPRSFPGNLQLQSLGN